MSAGARMPLHVDIKIMWRHPDGWFSNYPPPTGNGERVTVAEVTFRIGHGELGSQLARYASQEGLPVGGGSTYHSAGPGVDYSTLIGATVILGAAGGIGGIAAVLKVFFERNNGKKVTFGQDGEVLGVEGLSAKQIVRLLETLRDQRVEVEEENARSNAEEENES